MARLGGAERMVCLTGATGVGGETGISASMGTGGGVGAAAGLRTAGFLCCCVIFRTAGEGLVVRVLAVTGMRAGWGGAGIRGSWVLDLAEDFLIAPAMALT